MLAVKPSAIAAAAASVEKWSNKLSRVLSFPGHHINSDGRLNDSLFIPAIGAIISLTVLFIQFTTNARKLSRHVRTNLDIDAPENASHPPSAHAEGMLTHLTIQAQRHHGGLVIFAFKLARVFGCISLLILATVDSFEVENDSPRGKSQWMKTMLGRNLPLLSLVMTYSYCFVLVVLSLTSSQWSQTLVQHVNFSLFITFATYFYRDVWPLATYNQQPIDLNEGNELWIKIGLLALTGALIPLFVPRRYIPVDPKNPMKTPNPEQTASVFSLMVYAFMDPIVFEAYRVPHLSHKRLPPLADTDWSSNLTIEAFPLVDPFHGANKERHIVWGLIRFFSSEYFGMVASVVGLVIADFASPLAINRILAFLETEHPQTNIRPWFWVVLLFAGPNLVSLCHHGWAYLGTRALVRMQGILVQLVFEHSLRIRLKAETGGDSKDTGVNATDHTKPTSNTPETKKVNLVGRVSTLVTVDIDNIAHAKEVLAFVVELPLKLVLSCVFLYAILGWSALVGVGSIILLLPVPGYLAGMLRVINEKKMEKTDARVEAIAQTIGILRMIKLFGWEQMIRGQLGSVREDELSYLMKDKAVTLLIDLVNFVIPTITMLITYSCYTLIAGQPLTPSKIFSSMAVFDLIRNVLRNTSWILTMAIRCKVALDRISKFLQETELLDDFVEETSTEVNNSAIAEENDDAIGFNNAAFVWSKEANSSFDAGDPSTGKFRLRIPQKVEFRKGHLNLIIGPTGAGKTSILMALLGEMHFLPSSGDSWSKLPRESGVAYAAQESWVQNDTIRNNILFGSPYDEERYRKVLRQCALEPDLKMFDAGDATEVGERGLTLSGGQKARVTLARAVYSLAQVVLLDDILAALDVHTSKHIVRECFQGDLLKGRTIILVTHNVELCRSVGDHLIAVRTDGVVHEVEEFEDCLDNDKRLLEELQRQEEEAEIKEEVIDMADKPGSGQEDGKLILVEEMAEGHISWNSIKLYLNGLGGGTPAVFVTFWIFGTVLVHVSNMFSVWFLGYWGSHYRHGLLVGGSIPYYISLYSAILMLCVFLYAFVLMYYNHGTQRASRTIHLQLIDSILFSTLRWLDQTPASRILTRCTQDIATIDLPFTWNLNAFVRSTAGMVVRLLGPIYYTPIFLLPGLVLIVLRLHLGNIYLKCQMSVKRERSNARAPMLAHFGGSIAGLVSIRAYGSQQSFKAESLKRIDRFIKVSRTSYNLNRWSGIRTDFLGAIFPAALASYLLITRSTSAANTGFSLTMSLEFCSLMLQVVRNFNEVEVQANSLERIEVYLGIDQEPRPTEAGRPPASWPKSGELRVERLSACYSSSGPKVLNDLSFEIRSGERIGIVGRTGSGKSTLMLALLRCIFTEGQMFLDGVETNKINVDALRSNITVIPQMPELLKGTLRRNLDPFDEQDDATLNAALRAAGLFSVQGPQGGPQLTLDSGVSSGGNNLSVGQRQILALARAIVRNTKLLILDEATSAIDLKTDSIIQLALRNELSPNTTVLVITHRLQAIMDSDRVMVLDKGCIAEFETPRSLLQMKDGRFKALVDASSDRDKLYALASR